MHIRAGLCRRELHGATSLLVKAYCRALSHACRAARAACGGSWNRIFVFIFIFAHVAIPLPRSQLECQAMPLQPPHALRALALQRLAALRLRAVRLA